MLIVHPTKGQTGKMRPELIVRLEKLSSEVNLSRKKHPFSVECTTPKSPLDDFDNRETANGVDQGLDQESSIKNEEENFIKYNQYWISHEEVNIKSDDDLEQSDTEVSANTNEGYREYDKRVADHSTQPSTVQRYKCNNCGYIKACKPYLKNYVLVHRCPDPVKEDQIKIHKCLDCPYQSKDKSDVIKHSVRHRQPDEIVWHHCTECPYKTKQKGSLRNHVLGHNKIFKCAHCIYETPKRRNLKQHLLMHHKVNIIQKYSTESELAHKHDKPFKCTQCRYRANRRISLKWHLLKHESTDKWHACPQCPYKAIRKYCLKAHVLKHVNPNQVEWYMCEQCSYKTMRKGNLSRHAFIHMGHAKRLQCTSCSFQTTRKYSFRQHQMKHHGDADGSDWHKCPECPYKAVRKEHLLKHTKNHKAADQTDWLQCSHCSYRTLQINHLKTHKILHNPAVEWFRCFNCPYKTNLKASLGSHMKMHQQTGQDKLT